MGGERRGVHRPIVWGVKLSDKKLMKMKYNTALDGRQSMNLYTTTNQTQVALTDGTTEGRRDEREVQGSAILLFFGGGEVKRDVKN